MAPLFAFAAALLLSAPLASAIPNVTPVAIGTGCSAFPNYMPGDITGGFIFQASNADNSTVNGLQIGSHIVTTNGKEFEKLIIVTKEIAKQVLSCSKGQVGSLYAREGGTSLFVGDSGQVGFITKGGKLQSYQHKINGVAQDGTFVGSDNSTTWAFLHKLTSPAGTAGSRSYWEFRLLKAEDTLKTGEFKGFLKAVAW